MPKIAHSFRVEAIVLRHNDWGEADRLLVLYTREAGKVRAIAKGVRKLRSRKAGHLEPFTRATLQLARGRDLLIVTQAETVDAYMPLREDLQRTGLASYIVELVDRFTYEEGENPALYHLLSETMARLSTAADYFLAVRYYEIRLLDLLGFRPQLLTCVSCGAEIKAEDQYFSAELGGAVCPRCGARVAERRPVTKDALRVLRHYQRSDYAEAARLVTSESTRTEVENLIQYYLTYLLERALNTPEFMRQVKQ